ncbi:MAG: hypothetical protein AABY22_14830 [Nanoarchaeota archaeon]
MEQNYYYSFPVKIRELAFFPCKILDKYSNHIKEDLEISKSRNELREETSVLKKNTEDLRRLSAQIAISLL